MKATFRAALALSLVIAPIAALSAGYRSAHYRNHSSGWDIRIDYPVFSGGSLAPMANRLTVREVSAGPNFIAEAKKAIKEMGKPSDPFSYRGTSKVLMQRPNLIVMQFMVDEFLGGAHGSQAFHPYNVGMVGGRAKLLRLQDLFRSGVNGRAEISRLVIAQLKNDERAAWIQDGSVKEINAQNAEQFVITPSGLHFTFNPYEMGPYSSGMVEADVPFSALGRKLDPSGPLKSLLRSR